MLRFVVIHAKTNEVYAEPIPNCSSSFPLSHGMLLANRFMPPDSEIEIGLIAADNADNAISRWEEIEWLGLYRTPPKEHGSYVRVKDPPM